MFIYLRILALFSIDRLFPTRRAGMNSYAQELKSHEVEVYTVKCHICFTFHFRVISLINFHIIQKRHKWGGLKEKFLVDLCRKMW